MILKSRHLMSRNAWTSWAFMTALVLGLARAAVGDPADDEPIDEAPLPEPQFEISDATVYGRVFGEGADRVAAAEQLDTLLRQKIAIVDQFCGLTDIQKQKLQLAGHGDAKRLFDQVDEICAQLLLVRHDRGMVYELLDEAQRLQRDLVRPGLSRDGSLFFKSLDGLLTAKQTARYEPLRALVRAGGLARIRRGDATEMLEIRLPGSANVDDELAHLRELPGPHTLILDRSQVTDAGLAHLSGMSNLYSLSLSETRVTDEGLAELKGLKGLHELMLDGTYVTNAGIAHLKALTGLQYLGLKDTRVSDDGLVHLAGLARLELLVLDNTAVTDAGLAHLTGLAGLQTLLLRGTHVTDRGIAELRRSLPRLAIHK